jgi:DUF971 family protein
MTPSEPVSAASNDCQIDADLSALSLTLEDGSRQSLSAETLRTFCKCAHCTRARFDGRFPDRFPGIAIVGLADLGYGFNIAFSDGHDRGIYPRSYLLNLLTC